MKNLTTTAQEPAILTANTYFWSPASSATGRRSNEAKRVGEVAAWLLSLGLTLKMNENGTLSATNGTIDVHFSYSESCSIVRKSLSVSRNGKNSNITALRKLAA
ncbi:hypothetical protein [Hymenobacter cheonanensis]|uniref:hypothetical protein n=1 Tax=Hymenobacter sp. CA2-7 TaxID=3063993 RepID=UPI002712C58D|nr:hypothetical protein [Hymenobacter sp. CA2-7]MDO7885358.1 hypothetical protein [Hymenobacter sp. CA2-7]